MQLLVRKYGTIVDVTTDGVSPTPPDVKALLTPHMTYSHKKILRGQACWDTGEYRSIDVQSRELFEMVQGRFTTGYGYIPLIGHVLRQAGHEVHYVDISPPRKRPDCYTPNWNNLYQYIRPFDPANPHAPGQFRARQEECLACIANNEGGIIDAVTGFGKTHLFGSVALLFPRAKIHIVVRPTDVAHRIVRQLRKWVPSVGLIGDGYDERDCRVQVITADSLHKSDGDADFLIGEEAHQLMAESYSRGLGEHYRFSRNFAFTATPEGRLDGAHARMHMFFGPIIFRLTYPEAVALGLVVPIYVRWLNCVAPDGINPVQNRSGLPRMRWGIWRNQLRNKLIADDARARYDADTQVLALCASVEHMIHLWQFLPEYEMCYGSTKQETIEQYKKLHMLPERFTQASPERRNALRTAFEDGTLKKVIATDVWSTGVDFDRLQVVYRCDARDSEILDTQGPGRVSRIFHGKPYGEVVDVLDGFDKSLRNKSCGRRRHYAKMGWEQQWPGGARQISNEPTA